MSLRTDFEIRLEFLSDWHVGTGQGRLGAIDAEVRRDRDHDGLPFVPAKTLIGVWRDACETVAATFDRAAGSHGASGGWGAWITWLFGSQPARVGDPTASAAAPPVPAALRVTPAHAPTWLREAVRGRPALAQAAVVLRPGVQIDDDTGTAADRFLRVEERAIRGLHLSASASVIAGTGHLDETAELLLRAGARLVEAVGGKRSRGCGRVAVLLPGARVDGSGIHPTVTDPRLAELLATADVSDPSAPPEARRAPASHPLGRIHPGRDQRRTVRVVLEVLTPVVAAGTVLGNVISSRDSIPGTALLGMVLSRLEPTGRGSSGPIGLGDITVGDAVPAVGDPSEPASVVASLPVPRVWQRSDKGRGPTVRNTVHGSAPPGERAKPLDGRITAATGGGWQQISSARTVSTHAVVDDDARRPTATGGGVYTYVGIAPGTLLCSDIVLPTSARLRLEPDETLRLGRSRKDDFGLVRVVGVVDALPAPPAVSEIPAGELLVWCISDVLLRDERLAPDPSPRALARALSQELAPALFTVSDVDTVAGAPRRTVSAVVRRDGFGVAWGRPRPSQVAVRAGSVVSLTVTGRPDPTRMADLQRDGVGERTAEGYGRIRFNPPELAVAQPSVTLPASDRRTTRSAATAPPVAELHPDRPHPIEVNAWRRAVRRASAALPPDILIPGIDRMAGNRAQLGALRAQLERLTLPGPDGPGLVTAWVEATRAVRARREAWSVPLLDDLKNLLVADDTLLWHRLGLAGAQDDLVLAPGREPLIRAHLHTEALSIAVTDALRHLNRRGQPPTTGGDATAPERTQVRR